MGCATKQTQNRILNQNEERVVKIFDEKTRRIVNLRLEICAKNRIGA